MLSAISVMQLGKYKFGFNREENAGNNFKSTDTTSSLKALVPMLTRPVLAWLVMDLKKVVAWD